MRVLILCTGNSARSQMAEGLLRSMSNGTIDVHSAGTQPSGHVHPLAIETMRTRFEIDISGQTSKSADLYTGQSFDYVITVCDSAAANCPTFAGAAKRIHWSFADPAAVTDPEAARRAFGLIAGEIATRLRLWLTVIAKDAR